MLPHTILKTFLHKTILKDSAVLHINAELPNTFIISNGIMAVADFDAMGHTPDIELNILGEGKKFHPPIRSRSSRVKPNPVPLTAQLVPNIIRD